MPPDSTLNSQRHALLRPALRPVTATFFSSGESLIEVNPPGGPTSLRMRPPGRKTGQTWPDSPDAAAIEVTGVALPPAELTCINGPLPVAKTMLPSRPHAAPSPTALASQRVLATPVATETFFNLPSAKYPIEAP